MQQSSPTSIFINCPFDAKYLDMFRAIVITVFYTGCIPRCTLEVSDSGQQRLARILHLIDECPLGIHDISRTELDEKSQLPRFNMPFELGLFMGAAHFGGALHRDKRCLILDSAPHRYDIFLSDISGCDPVAHSNDIENLIRRVLSWLKRVLRIPVSISAHALYNLYKSFDDDFRKMCGERNESCVRMPYEDYPEFTKNVTEWLRDNVS